VDRCYVFGVTMPATPMLVILALAICVFALACRP
jgi:hypothetical protein